MLSCISLTSILNLPESIIINKVNKIRIYICKSTSTPLMIPWRKKNLAFYIFHYLQRLLGSRSLWEFGSCHTWWTAAAQGSYMTSMTACSRARQKLGWSLQELVVWSIHVLNRISATCTSSTRPETNNLINAVLSVFCKNKSWQNSTIRTRLTTPAEVDTSSRIFLKKKDQVKVAPISWPDWA